MGSFFQRKGVRKCMMALKWCRVASLFAIFLIVTALSYLHMVGLPNYLKKPLLGTLREKGFNVQFTRASLGWGPSIIIEEATFRSTNETAGPILVAAWTHLDLNRSAFIHGHIRVDGFELAHASIDIPVGSTNLAPLSLTNVSLRVTIASNNYVVVKEGRAAALGVHVGLAGEITNVFAMANWKLPPPSAQTNASPGLSNAPPNPPRLTAWEIIQKIQFTGTPDLTVHFYADGRDPNTLKAELGFNAEGGQTPWGKFGLLHLRAACSQLLNSRGAPFFQSHFNARGVSTRWADCGDLAATIDFSRFGGTNVSAFAHIIGTEVKAKWENNSSSNWVSIGDAQWDGTTTIPQPGFRPETFQGALRLVKIQSPWVNVDSIALQLQSRRAVDGAPDPAWGVWNKFKPYIVDWQAGATNITTPKLKLDHISFNGAWHPPLISIDTMQASMYKGFLNSSSTLDVNSRQTTTGIYLDFDPHQIAPILTEAAQHWIGLYDWDTPPKFNANLRYVLPPWTNRPATWAEDLRDSLQLAGDFSVGRGAFRGVAVNSAQAHYGYTNRMWSVSGLRVSGEGGSVSLDYDWNDASSDYHFRFDSRLKPSVAMPLLSQGGQLTLQEMDFPEAPELSGDVWGNWKTPKTAGLNALLAATNAIIRGEPVAQLNANFHFTNLVLTVSNLALRHKSGRAEIPLATINFTSNIYYLSNASSQLDPVAVRHALGKIEPPWMKELDFDTPPLVRATGQFTPGNDDGTDLRFFVQGRKLHWNHITADTVRGDVYYHVRTVEATNIQGTLYGSGTLLGWFVIDWFEHGTKFVSDATLKDVDLAKLAKEFTGKTNSMEGLLDAHLYLGAPYNADYTNMFGNGWLHIHNALLWDIKLFGLLSPILNAIAPGSGDSRAREASASFLINKGVLDTEDLDIHSSGFRLLYRGTVDSQKRLNARVEANLLRDTPLFGHFLSWMLTPLDKLFEYRVSGTLDKPEMKPVFIPKVFMEMLRPFHTLKQMSQPSQSATPVKPKEPAPATPPP